jgi:hypothetical protein
MLIYKPTSSHGFRPVPMDSSQFIYIPFSSYGSSGMLTYKPISSYGFITVPMDSTQFLWILQNSMDPPVIPQWYAHLQTYQFLWIPPSSNWIPPSFYGFLPVPKDPVVCSLTNLPVPIDTSQFLLIPPSVYGFLPVPMDPVGCSLTNLPVPMYPFQFLWIPQSFCGFFPVIGERTCCTHFYHWVRTPY